MYMTVSAKKGNMQNFNEPGNNNKKISFSIKVIITVLETEIKNQPSKYQCHVLLMSIFVRITKIVI